MITITFGMWLIPVIVTLVTVGVGAHWVLNDDAYGIGRLLALIVQIPALVAWLVWALATRAS